MKEQLYIPKEIRVGFQNREDTFTKKLAYVVYVDDNGVLRKEKSWNSWCDNKIEKLSYKNEPTSGFMLNKNVQRYNWGHFSSNRSYIRVHDPRGFEFEITPENLLGILMDGDCNKRVLDGEFVYSWSGTELVLLPCHTEGYKASKKYTELQGKNMSATDLVPGCIYRTKKQEDLIYLGKFMWYEKQRNSARKGKNKFIFIDTKKWKDGKIVPGKFSWEKDFIALSDIKSISVCVNETPVEDYAHIMDEFNSTIESQKITGVILEPIVKWPDIKYGEFGVVKISDTEYVSYIKVNDCNERGTPLSTISDDQQFSCYVYHYTLDPKTNSFVIMKHNDKWGYSREKSFVVKTTKAELVKKGISKLKYRLENGKLTKSMKIGD